MTPLGPVTSWPRSLRTVVDLVLPVSVPMAVLWGPRHHLVYNDAWRDLMGLRHAEGLGQAIQQCWPEVWERTAPMLARVLAGDTVTFEATHPPIDRPGALEDVWSSLSGSPLRDEMGAIAGILLTFRETAHRRQVETALQTSEARRRTLSAVMEEGYGRYQMIAGPDGTPVDMRILEVNATYEQVMQRWDPVGKRLTEVEPGLDQEWLDALAAVARTGEPQRFERYNARLDCWFDVHVTPTSGQPGEVVLVFSDITEHKQVEEALRRNERWARAQNAAFEAAMDGAPLSTSLGILAALVNAETGGEARTAFYLADADGALLHPVRGAGNMPNAYLDEVDGFRIGEDSLACGLAVPTGQPVITPDVQTDPRSAAWVGVAQAFDFRGCWSFPIKTRERQAVGTFGMYFRDEREATPDDLALADAVTQAAAVIIASRAEATERVAAESALLASEERYRAIFSALDEGYALYEVLFDDAGRPIDACIHEVNPAYKRLTGRDNPIGKRLNEVSSGLDPEWGAAMAEVVRTGQPVRFEGRGEELNRWFDVFVGPMDGPGDPYVVLILNDITARKHAVDALRASEARHAFLLQFSDALRPLEDAIEIQQVAMRLVGEHLQVDRTMLNELRDDGETIHIEDIYVRDGLPPIRGDFAVRAFGAAMDVLRRGETLVIEDHTTTPLKTPPERETSTSLGIYASATVPLIKGGRWVANFGVLHGSPRQWTPDEISILQEAARRTWAALEHTRAEKALRESKAQLAAELADATRLQEVSSQLLQAGNSDALYGQILDAAISLMRADAGSMQVLDPARNELMLLAERGLAPASTAFWQRVTLDSNTSCAAALATGGRVIVADVETSPFMAGTEALEAYRWSNLGAAQSTPLLARDGRVVGMISTHWHTPHRPTDRELRLIDVLTRQAADLLERARAENALRESEERNRLIVERATDYAIFSTDSDRRIETWPPGAAAVYGWTAREAVGQLMDITYMASDRAAGVPEQEFTQAREAGHAPNVRWHMRKDGTYVFIEGDAYARRTEQGTFQGVFKIGQDITARLAAEEAQREEDAARREEEATLREELEVQVRAGTAELRQLSRRLLAVQEEERRKLALELHDEVGQMLTGLNFQLAAAQGLDGASALTEAQTTVQALTEQVRQLSLDLRPQVLDRYGLLAALEWHIERFQAKTGITVHLRHQGLNRRFPPEVEIAAFRVVQEALTNVARHSGENFATVQVYGDGSLTLVIRDAGRGFDPAQADTSTGLAGMRERVELLGGKLEVEAIPGDGTAIIAELPAEFPGEAGS
jgi:PAS domain S-box-containing protein